MKPWVVDALLATAVTVVLSAIVALSQAAAEEPPNILAYVFTLGFGAVLLLRRSMPIPVLLLSVLGTFGYYILDLPPIGVALPVVAALFSAAEVGLTRWAVGAGASVFAVSLYFRLRDEPPPLGYLLGYDTVSNIALIAAGIALGFGVRVRRIQAAQQAEIARLTDAQLEREAYSRMQHERERISRDLHDTVGHTMSVISLQANVGTEALGHDDRAVNDALARIRTASTRSLQELRSMLRIRPRRNAAHPVAFNDSGAGADCERCRCRGHHPDHRRTRRFVRSRGRGGLSGDPRVDHQHRSSRQRVTCADRSRHPGRTAPHPRRRRRSRRGAG